MKIGRQEVNTLGELAVFLVAWMVAIFATMDDYHGRVDPKAGPDIAATSSFSNLNNELE